jgi:hypothetical protein
MMDEAIVPLLQKFSYVPGQKSGIIKKSPPGCAQRCVMKVPWSIPDFAEKGVIPLWREKNA